MFLVPFVVIIPTYLITVSQVSSMYKIAMYLAVFHEGAEFNWERRLSSLAGQRDDFGILNGDAYFHAPFVVFAAVCSILFSLAFPFGELCANAEPLIAAELALCLATLACVLAIFAKYRDIGVVQGRYASTWRGVMSEELSLGAGKGGDCERSGADDTGRSAPREERREERYHRAEEGRQRLGVSEKEFDYLQELLDKNEDAHRNVRYIVYSAMIALMALFADSECLFPALFLVPYVLLVPIACRVAYSRLRHAKFNALLWSAHPEWRMHQNPDLRIRELDGRLHFADRLIEVGVIYDPAFVGGLCSLVAVWRALGGDGMCSMSLALIAAASVGLFTIVLAVLTRSRQYGLIKKDYIDQWDEELLRRGCSQGSWLWFCA